MQDIEPVHIAAYVEGLQQRRSNTRLSGWFSYVQGESFSGLHWYPGRAADLGREIVAYPPQFELNPPMERGAGS
jgi:hypothetical protein